LASAEITTLEGANEYIRRKFIPWHNRHLKVKAAETGNAFVPCLHADPVLPDCPPGETVRVRGRLWFYEGKDADAELERVAAEFK